MNFFQIGKETFPRFEKQIWELWANIFNRDIPKNYEVKEFTRIFVVSFHGELIAMGMLEWLESNSIWYLFNFGVKFTYRKQGVGKFLWNELKRFANNNLVWEIKPNNFQAISFYTKMGGKVLMENEKAITMTICK